MSPDPRPRFAHAVAAAAAVPFASLMILLALVPPGASPEEVGMRKFLMMIFLVIGYPIALSVAGAVFGLGWFRLKTTARAPWPSVLWGAVGAVITFAVLWFLPPHADAEPRLAGVLLGVILVGALSGWVFWWGGIRPPRVVRADALSGGAGPAGP